MLLEYIRKHNTTTHSITGQTPLERYLATNERIRKPRDREWLEECFHSRIIRRVNRDATVNPFDKQCIKERDAFRSQDHRQMQSRLDYLRTVRDIGAANPCNR